MTKHLLTPGKWRGLKATSSPTNSTFSILAFDQRGNYRSMLPADADFAMASRIKTEVVTALAPYITAVLLDPVYGLDAVLALPGDRGLLMPIEKTGYAGSPTERKVDFMPGWEIETIKRVGASAVKLLVYYHPDAGAITDEVDATVRRIAAACHEQDLPLFVEPLSYSIDESASSNSAEFAAERPRLVRETARRLSQMGVDILKLEFPVNIAFAKDENVWRRECEAVSQAVSIPWTLLSAGVDFPDFERQVKVACESGGSGFVGGRAIWKEAVTMTTSERARFLPDEGVRRLDRLREIVERSARPWTDFYAPVAFGEDWYDAYAAALRASPEAKEG
jgi:tagatose 1,6-diphosphate aldolase